MPRKGKEKPAAASGPTSLASMGLEAFEIIEVPRDKLLGASYNPRIITDNERKKLRAGIKRHGLVAPITWNKRTGNIVGGHQRLRELDALAGTADYTLKVAAVDVDDVREKEINLLLNNAMAMGDWDLPKLEQILRTNTLQVEGTGFDIAEMTYGFVDHGETLFDAIVRISTKADHAYCILCERCGQPIHDHETPIDCAVFARYLSPRSPRPRLDAVI
jgi:hypothetical protein